MKRRKLLAWIGMSVTSLLLVIGSQLVNLSPAASTTTLNVYAAISLTNALNDIKTNYESLHPDVNIVYTFGASGTLLNSIEAGNPADIFISAATDQIDTLDSQGKLVSGSRKNIVTNTLVLIAPTTPPVSAGSAGLTSFNGLTNSNITGIAIGDPSVVPAGKYATEVFNYRGIYSAIQPKLVLDSNVRAVLTDVENKTSSSGQTIDAGCVYITDQNISNKVRLVDTAQPQETDPIVYPGAILASTQVLSTAQDFSNYLSSGAAQGVFRAYKFGLPSS